jgi:hypothetical protein
MFYSANRSGARSRTPPWRSGCVRLRLRHSLTDVLDRLRKQKETPPVRRRCPSRQPNICSATSWVRTDGLGIRIRSSAQLSSTLRPPGRSAGRHELERALLERGVLERALHLIGASRVPRAKVQVLGDRVERRPPGPGAVTGCISTIRRPSNSMLDCSPSALVCGARLRRAKHDSEDSTCEPRHLHRHRRVTGRRTGAPIAHLYAEGMSPATGAAGYRACWIDPDSKKRPPLPGHHHDGALGSRHCSEAQPDHHSVAGCYITPPTPARARAA